jgi:EAL domain-containing protein (putative c-di-GMP-specific phosphodiesterase class I)
MQFFRHRWWLRLTIVTPFIAVALTERAPAATLLDAIGLSACLALGLVARNQPPALASSVGAVAPSRESSSPHAIHGGVVAELDLGAELRAAIDAEELTLAYQPIFDLATGEIEGYEALSRWEHSSLGTIAPGTFIPLAEDCGLIVPLGRWVLQQACSDAAALERAQPEARPRCMSVNLSPCQLKRPEIVDEVRDALRSSGLEPSRLVLEITESRMIDDVGVASERLTELRDLGVLVAVDDFGVGYSSLNYIRQLPIDILKVDKRFIADVDSEDDQSTLTAAIIDLVRAMNLRSVAEGVERPEQNERLQQLGFDCAQGFLLGRPMGADALLERLISGPPEVTTAV